MTISRNYKFKDVEMLMASKTLIKNLSQNLGELSLARSNWTQSFVDTLEAKIDDAIENYLGLDKKKELRDATALVTTIQAPALRDLSFLKKQIEVDFSKTAKSLLKKLGYDKNHRNAHKGDQEALIQLLYSFKKEMNDKLKTEMVSKGTNPELIDRIVSYADQLKTANVSQETLKETTKLVSEEALKLFSEIYDEIIGICKIASIFYQYDSIKKEQFTFSKAINNMKAAKRINKQEEAA
ncbi:MAG: hypothetical protein JXB17_00590 [Bacteroidales bacterium]|nr:hypothetical protein [Bacteroidales bacterium]